MFTGELLTKPCREIDRAWSGTCADPVLCQYSSWEGRKLCVTQLFTHIICITVKPIFAILAALTIIAVSPLHLIPFYLLPRCCMLEPNVQFAKALGNLLGSIIISPWTQTALAARAFAGIFDQRYYFRLYDESRLREAILERDFRGNNLGTDRLRDAPPELKENKAIVDLALNLDPFNFRFASPILQGDKDYVLKTLRRNGKLLAFVSPELRNDAEVVCTAVRNSHGDALRYANPELKKDPAIVHEALKSKPEEIFFHIFFRHVDPSLMEIRTFVLDAIEIHEAVYRFAKDDLLDDEFNLEAVKRNGLVLRYLSDTDKSNETIALTAIENNPEAMQYVSRRLRDDDEFALKALTLNGCVFKYLNDLQRNNRELVLAAIESHPISITFASEELRSNADFLIEAAKKNGFIGFYIQHFALEQKDTVDFFSEAEANILKRLKLLTRSERECVLSEIRQHRYLSFALQLESALREHDKPMLNLDNIHFTFSSPEESVITFDPT